MSAKKTTGWVAAVVFGVAIGAVITSNLGIGQNAGAQVRDNLPLGRSAAGIQDGLQHQQSRRTGDKGGLAEAGQRLRLAMTETVLLISRGQGMPYSE